MTDIYLYAITPSPPPPSLPHPTLTVNGFSAIVNPNPLPTYHGLPRETLLPHLLEHQRVIEQAMQTHPVLPVKFGTLLPNPASARRLLAGHSRLFTDTLIQLAGQVQIELLVLWPLAEIFQEIGQEAPLIALKQQTAGLPPEQLTSLQIEVGRQVQANLEQRRQAAAQTIINAVQPLTLDLIQNARLDDSMIINLALLLEQNNLPALDETLHRLDETFAGRFTLRQVGPLPPHNFATLQIESFSFAAIDHARRLLNLPAAADWPQIKQAYHAAAARHHPDRNPNNPHAAAQMSDLTQAYRLLQSYARQIQTQTQTPVPTPLCRFDARTVAQVWQVAVIRPEVAP